MPRNDVDNPIERNVATPTATSDLFSMNGTLPQLVGESTEPPLTALGLF